LIIVVFRLYLTWFVMVCQLSVSVAGGFRKCRIHWFISVIHKMQSVYISGAFCTDWLKSHFCVFVHQSRPPKPTGWIR
jgi:hypothetical protein